MSTTSSSPTPRKSPLFFTWPTVAKFELPGRRDGQLTLRRHVGKELISLQKSDRKVPCWLGHQLFEIHPKDGEQKYIKNAAFMDSEYHPFLDKHSPCFYICWPKSSQFIALKKKKKNDALKSAVSLLGLPGGHDLRAWLHDWMLPIAATHRYLEKLYTAWWFFATPS